VELISAVVADVAADGEVTEEEEAVVIDTLAAIYAYEFVDAINDIIEQAVAEPEVVEET